MPEDIAGPLISCGVVVLIVVVLVIYARRQIQHFEALNAFIAGLRSAEGVLLCFHPWDGAYQLTTLNGENLKHGRAFILCIKASEIALYDPKSTTFDQIFSFAPEQVRWFGRPQKYHGGVNEIWLHLEVGTGWHLLKLHMGRAYMHDVVRALKSVLPAELVTAYRRQRPYIHYGPISVQPAHQDIHGSWTLQPPLHLYLMPLFLLVIDGLEVIRKIPLETIQQVGALQRLDRPDAQGLVRFQIEGEKMAFALDKFEVFATSLAEAAKRTLEEPMLQKQKKKEDDEEWE